MQLKKFTDIQSQDVILTHTTNPRFKYLEDETMKISYRDNVIVATMREFSNFHTSYVKSMEILNNLLRVTTRNSVYTFEFHHKDLWKDSEVITEDRKELEEKIQQIETAMRTSVVCTMDDASCTAPAFITGGCSFADSTGE